MCSLHENYYGNFCKLVKKFFILDRVFLFSQGWPRTNYITQDDVKLQKALLPQPPKCIDYKYKQPFQARFKF